MSYTYDAVGRLLTAANGTDTLTWTYDLAGQVLTEQSSKNSSTVSYTYDTGGNRLTVGLDGTLFVTYAYDDAARLTTITRGTNAFTFGYDNANRRTSLGYPNGVNTTYAYDTLSRLTSLSAVAAGPTTITSFAYTYDAAGNRLSKAQPDHTETYMYDPLYRLNDVARMGSLTGEWHYRYDPVGNRLSTQVNSAVTTASFNEKNQLLSSTGGGPLRVRGILDEPGTAKVNGIPAAMVSGNAFEATIQTTTGTNTFSVEATDYSGNVTTKTYSVTATGSGATYTYDANGNLTQKVEGTTIWTYEWNAENQLTRVLNNGSEVARYKYDPLGRRVERVAGATTTLWTYDGADILREVVGASTTKYVHGPGSDEPLAQEDGAGALTHIHADGLGSVVKTTSAGGTVISSRRYDAFGNLELGAVNGHAFTGREWDTAASLAYYRARYYDPTAGRFISSDPAGFDAGINFYTYVENNPISQVDPSGLASMQNNSGRAIPVKPEVCPPDGPCPIQLCMPGATCNVDGVYPPDCKTNPIKIVNGCTGIATPDGKLAVTCPFFLSGPNIPLKQRFPRLGQRAIGGLTSDGFMDDNKDWAPPGTAPGCQNACAN